MKFIFFLFSYFSLSLQTENNIEIENNFDGEIIPEISVNVINGYDFPVEVYFDDNQGGILLVSSFIILSLILSLIFFLIFSNSYRWN